VKLDSWMRQPRREQGEGVRLISWFESEIPPVVRLKLKIEGILRFLPPGATFDLFKRAARVQRDVMAQLPGNP
jgi:hypothetical protein